MNIFSGHSGSALLTASENEDEELVESADSGFVGL